MCSSVITSNKDVSTAQHIKVENYYCVSDTPVFFVCVCVCNKVLLKYKGDRESF